MGDPCSYSHEDGPLFGILLLVAGIFFLYGAFGDTGTSGMLRILAGIIAANGPMLAAGIIDTYNQTVPRMDPQMILSQCKDEWNSLKSAKSDIERLEIVYENAVNMSRKALYGFLERWIETGVALGLLLLGILKGWFTLSTVIQLSSFILSLVGMTAFFLMVFTYLRYRDYTKQLLAIQLKKSDKAELSIKI